MTTLKQATVLLDRLIELDKITTTHAYEIGQLLSAIKRNKLFEVLGYDSVSHLIEEELSFGASQGFRYANTYDHFLRLKYNKADSIKLLNSFGFTNVSHVLPEIKTHIGYRAFTNRIKEFKADNHQVNFTLNGGEYADLRTALTEQGADELETGRLMNSSQALMHLVYMALDKKRAA